MKGASFEVEEVREGLSNLLVPRLEMYRESPQEYVPSRAPVFYNPLMKENRDLAIAFLKVSLQESRRDTLFGEPLTGTGVRGIRAVLEAGVKHAWINDISKIAAKMAEKNVERNRVGNCITVENKEANMFNLSHMSGFNYLDLDPFGSPSPFLDSAIRAVRNEGAIAVTATDTATLCGVYPQTAIARYGGRSVKTIFPKEFAARLLIYAIVTSAARSGFAAEPLLAYASRHYIRVYARVRKGRREAARAMDETGHILYCSRCYQRGGLRRKDIGEVISMACPICGKRRELAGPIWLGGYSDTTWVEMMYMQTDESFEPRTRRMLRRLSLEDTTILGSYPVTKISEYSHRSPPSRQQLLEKLKAAGLRACETVFDANAIKTEAQINEILELL